MLKYNTFKIIIAAVSLTILLHGCAATPSGTGAGRAERPVQQGEHVAQESSTQSPVPAGQAEQKTGESAQAPPLAPVFGHSETTETTDIKVDPVDAEFVKRRLAEYENKFVYWLEISEMSQEGELAEEMTTLETECVQKLERILTGYSLLLERMQQSDTVPFDRIATVDPKNMQQLDIAFLESRCGELLAMDIPARFESKPAAVPEISFDGAQEIIASHVTQGNYQEALFAYGRLALDFPNQKPSLATELNYGFALQYTGQVEAAARHFKDMLDSDALSIGPLGLQRKIADLHLAGGNIAAAESSYDSIILAQETILAEKTWAEEQLAFLRSVDPESEDMIAYRKLMREFQIYDYRIYAPQLNEAINTFAQEHAGSPHAVSALRLKNFAVNQLKLWFGRQMLKIDTLAAEKRFTEATDILKDMSRYYLPAEMQALVQKTYYELSQAEIQEIETQQRIQAMELTEQWDSATNLLDSQRYDLAIAAFEALMGTEYEEKAKMKINEAANQAAGQMRKEAASLFVRAGKTPDLEQKKELLLASHRLLTEILAKYPQTDLVEKVQQNISILETQIQRFDPALLEELQQETPAESPADPSGPYTRQLR